MNFLKNVLLCCLLVVSAIAADKTADRELVPKEITIGFTPTGNNDLGKKGALALAEALQEELNLPVNVFISKNYSGLIDAMAGKKIDFAFFPSMPFVFAEKKAGAKVLLKKVWEEPYYYSILLSLQNSGVKSLKDLKGKKIAFVDEKSTSGFLYPQVMLKKNGIDSKTFKSVQYSGSHAESVRLLAQKKVDVIAVFSDDKAGKASAWTKYHSGSSTKGQVNLLWVSDPIPNDPFCVRQDFYDQHPKLTHSLMFSLIDIVDRLKNRVEIGEFVGAKGFVPATTKQYDPVREMVKELELQLQ